MRRLFLGTTMVAMAIGFSGCTSAKDAELKSELGKSFEEYKTYKSNKAMAVAMGDDGRYAMGYAYDYVSQDRANARAIKLCTDANNQTEGNKVDAECKIYAIDNDIVDNKD